MCFDVLEPHSRSIRVFDRGGWLRFSVGTQRSSPLWYSVPSHPSSRCDLRSQIKPDMVGPWHRSRTDLVVLSDHSGPESLRPGHTISCLEDRPVMENRQRSKVCDVVDNLRCATLCVRGWRGIGMVQKQSDRALGPTRVPARWSATALSPCLTMWGQ
jgi:hypothetical protein